MSFSVIFGVFLITYSMRKTPISNTLGGFFSLANDFQIASPVKTHACKEINLNWILNRKVSFVISLSLTEKEYSPVPPFLHDEV